MNTILDQLENESIFYLREVHAEFRKPVVLFSGGKDSAVVLHLVAKAFANTCPFAVMHVDTGQNFPEAIHYRDEVARKCGLDLRVASVEESLRRGRVQDDGTGTRNRIQSVTLLDALEEGGFDLAIGGARRDEDRARAKERIFSHRMTRGGWRPEMQRPEIFELFNTQMHEGESFRVFPISNWTELDVWQYIAREGIDLPSLYFAQRRQVFERNGMLYAVNEHMQPRVGEHVFEESVRFRTVGDATCTACIRSDAKNLEEILLEVQSTRISERGATRADDQLSKAAMEDRKREGYF